MLKNIDMHVPFGTYALELMTSLERATRRGRLDLCELREAYLCLSPSGHALAHDPRKLDLDALVRALLALPEEIFDAPEVLVVLRLDAYTHTPREGGSFAAGLLADGRLLLEASQGFSSLLGMASVFCVIAHELEKARKLARAEGELATLAFVLGVDEEALVAADARCRGRLIALLESNAKLPEISLHAALNVRALDDRASARAERIVTTLAELGLASRELRLWIGGPAITDCLSPYTRDLSETLLAWAAQNEDALGDDLCLDDTTNEDVFYALAYDFARADLRLEPEKREADRSVGIERDEVDGIDFDIIDLRRLDLGADDPRLGDLRPSGEAPVLLRISPKLEERSGAAFMRLFELLAPKLASVTLALEGTAFAHPPGTQLWPEAAICWQGEWLATLPGPRAARRDGVVLSAPRPELLSLTHITELSRTLRLLAIDTHGATLVNTLATAACGGVLARTTDLHWSLVTTHYLASGRPDLASQGGLAARAIDELVGYLTPPAPRASSPAPPRPPGGSPRAVRLKV